MSAALPTVGVRAAATEKLWESMQSLCYVDLPMFQAALREGADINCRELGRDFVRQLCYNLLKRQPGVRPLTLIRENRASIEEALRLLLAQPGLDVNAPGPGESALHAAMRMERPEAFVPDLLRVGADVRAVDSSTGNTPLHLARSPDVIDILLAAGAELAPNTFGQTPLHLRAQYADVECLSRLLLHPGAAAVLNAVEFNGQTPLHWHPDKALAMVKMLLRAGVDCTIADDYGRVPVDWEWVLHEYAHVPTRARVGRSGGCRRCCGGSTHAYAWRPARSCAVRRSMSSERARVSFTARTINASTRTLQPRRGRNVTSVGPLLSSLTPQWSWRAVDEQ